MEAYLGYDSVGQWGTALSKVALCYDCDGVSFGTRPRFWCRNGYARTAGFGAGVVTRRQLDGSISAYTNFVSPQFCSAPNPEARDI